MDFLPITFPKSPPHVDPKGPEEWPLEGVHPTARVAGEGSRKFEVADHQAEDQHDDCEDERLD